MWHSVGILINPMKAECAAVADRLEGIFLSYGVRCVRGLPEDRAALSACDFLCVLGGDGTILAALDIALPAEQPILGINLGRLGFLTEIEPAHMEDGIAQLMAGKWQIEERTLMRARAESGESAFALNEIAIVRAGVSARILTIEADVNGYPVARVSGRWNHRLDGYGLHGVFAFGGWAHHCAQREGFCAHANLPAYHVFQAGGRFGRRQDLPAGGG